MIQSLSADEKFKLMGKERRIINEDFNYGANGQLGSVLLRKFSLDHDVALPTKRRSRTIIN